MLDWNKFKAFVDKKLIIVKMIIFLPRRIENIVGKGENAGNQHFLLLPQCFQKASFSRSGLCGKGLKGLWERKKMLEISILPFHHIVFNPSKDKAIIHLFS